ncbi:MAG TPA: sulfurtransferase [Myxococcaceae bacterium]|nr:sulfurtransferase [Myxococcaceae bacterium]
MADYAHPEVLVTTDWLRQNLKTPNVRIVEIDVDPKLYAAGHIPGAAGWDWTTQLQDQVKRDIISKENFEKLNSEAGIKNSDTVIIYGDSSNWFAAYGFWLYKIYGHKDVRLLNGGRAKWLNEEGAPLTTDVEKFSKSEYRVGSVDAALRAKVPEVLAASDKKAPLVDVRSPDEFTGKIIAPPGMSETAQRAGHIPGATSIPWSTAVTTENTFKSPDELRAIYLDQKRLDPGKATIAYCRIGERSSHTWFVLKYLLGFKDVKNYDGSWTEYGNLIGAPIEKGG